MEVLCANCNKRKGTKAWVGHGDVVSFVHSVWCEICVVDAQLRHAQERAAAIPELEAKLRELLEAAGEETCGVIRFDYDGKGFCRSIRCGLPKGHWKSK